MSKLSIFKIEDVSTDDFNGYRIECFVGTDATESGLSFKKVIFENQSAALCKLIRGKLKGEDEWESNDEFTDCLVISGEAERVAIKPHYRFTRDKKGNLVKASPEKVVRFLKVVAISGESIEGQIAAYEYQIPDSCKIEEKEEE